MAEQVPEQSRTYVPEQFQPEEPDPFGRSDLHYAAALGDLDEVSTLLAAGADPHEPDSTGFTPLHLAAQEQRPQIARLLLDAGADIHAQDRWGNTPLWRAVFHSHGQMATVSVLLDAGADPTEVNASGVSPRTLSERMAGQPAI